MALSKELCVAELQDEIHLFWWAVLASIGLTTLNVLLYVLCFRKAFEGAPGIASQFFLVTGSIKTLCGLLVAVLFQPSCPDRCSQEVVCDAQDIPSPLYALIVSLVGLLWLYKGHGFYQKAQTLENGESQGGEDTTFQEVPTVEVV